VVIYITNTHTHTHTLSLSLFLCFPIIPTEGMDRFCSCSCTGLRSLFRTPAQIPPHSSSRPKYFRREYALRATEFPQPRASWEPCSALVLAVHFVCPSDVFSFILSLPMLPVSLPSLSVSLRKTIFASHSLKVSCRCY
jgi:hypothetical protein